MDKQMKKLWHLSIINMSELSLSLKKEEEILPFATIKMDLQDITLSEMSKMYDLILHVRGRVPRRDAG